MSEILNLYPTLTESGVNKAGISIQQIKLSYRDDNDYFPINIEIENGNEKKYIAVLKDERVKWSAETHNLIIHKAGTIKHPDTLFGSNGIAPHDSVIGVAAIWSSKKSDLHGTIQYGEFSLTSAPYSFDCNYTFERSILRGSLKYKLVLYLKYNGNPYPEEMHLANQTGTILGVLEEFELYVDGNGSIFPIKEVNNEGKPLWWVDFDITADIFEDLFDDEHVVVCLNRAHPCFPDLSIEESYKNSPLFREVISSALYIIVMSVKELADNEWDNVITGNNLEPGTIAEATFYFINKLGWDVSSPTALAKSIHKYFDENLQ
ncbi:hypothetical protein [Ruminococcus flavefaciens]|uniref:hypothetical protein n=1 Tax=Ruminococcus flavefaciens TaxID=1265 RepID=UPI00030C54CE|nr:hypothetical protein [Ruminococcus flavefaciens]